MKRPFAAFEPRWDPHGHLPPRPPPRPRHTAHPYQGARAKRGFAAQRQIDIDGVVRIPFNISNVGTPRDEVRDYHHLRLTPSIPNTPS